MARLDIESLKKESGTNVEGLARVCSVEQKIAKNDSPYLLVRLCNLTGYIPALCWPNRYHGNSKLHQNDIIALSGKTKLLPDGKMNVIELTDADRVSNYDENPISLLPPAIDNKQELVRDLVTLMDSLKIRELKKMLYAVFMDEGLTHSYIAGKASESYHHNEPGELLAHSLEVAQIVTRHRGMVPDDNLEVGIAAALLHDIAKTKAWYNQPRSKPQAPVPAHDSRTLEMLATPLADLGKVWADGAELLRHCLEYKITKNTCHQNRYHVPTIVTIVDHADYDSASSYEERKVAACRKTWKKYYKMNGRTFYAYDPPPQQVM